jgi:two-component system chemotaxis response regulator CheY
MMTGNADPCGRTALPGADAVPTTPHILIAEDHPAIQELLCWVLQRRGYRTMACAGRQAALTWIDRAMPSGDCPALILLDLSIPCTNDAANFLYHLRARWHDTCGVLPQIIVLTTCKKVQEDLMPMERVVLKPFHVRDLMALIQRVISSTFRSESHSSSGECPSDQ